MSESMNKKTLIILGGGIIGIIILILLITFIISITKKHYIKPEVLESKMVEAARKYYSKNTSLLPSVSEETMVSYDTLTKEQYIKPINEMIKDGNKCNAHVTVNNNNSQYIYTPYLYCEGIYETKELYKILLDTNEVVTNGSGLYSDSNGGYYFKGEVTNNYIKLGQVERYSSKKDNIWKIMSIESDNTIKIKSTLNTGKTYVWDDRYNETKKSNYGYNNFEMSRIKDTLKSLNESNIMLSDIYKNKLVARKLCIAKKNENDEDKTGTHECSVLSEDVYLFGLLNPYEYMRSSLDYNCKNILSPSCANYNYLSENRSSEWTLNAYANNDYQVYTFDGKNFSISGAYNNKNIYPTAYLNNKTYYVSGTGTYSDPYIIK